MLKFISNLLILFSCENFYFYFTTLSFISSGLVIIYLVKIWWSYKFFKRLGIKTPTGVEFFYGHFREIQREKYSEALKKWTKIYGKTYGYYEGHMPILVTSDVDLIKEIFISQASNFSARKFVPAQYKDNDWDTNVGSASRMRWKRMRTLLSSTFTPQKLKEILPTMKMCTERFLFKIENNLNKEIILADDVKKFSMDTLANSVFGISSNIQENENSPLKMFFDFSNELIDQGRGFHPFILLNTYFYELKALFVVPLHFFGKLCQKMGYEIEIPFFWLQRHLFKLVTLRLSQKNTKTRDYLQIMIDSLSENSTIKDELDLNLMNVRPERKMTTRELSNNLFVFLIAGYDTTYTTLNYCLYVLSKYPNEMVKLQEEIDSYEQNSDIDYETIAEMKYLDLFIKEVLRLYPIASPFVTRRCTKQTKINGLNIPLDLVVAVDVLSLHYDQKYWGPVSTEEFYPLRFEDESKLNPCAYFGFGLGPRICLGMKFALLEIKLTLIRLLKNYNVNASDRTPERLEFDEGFLARRPKQSIPVVITKRI